MNLKNDKKPNFEAQLDIAPSYHPLQVKGKLINQTWENGKKPNFGPNFGLFDPNLDPWNFFAAFTSTSSCTIF